MLKRFIKYNRFFDIINFKESEFWFALIISIIFTVLLLTFGIYKNFNIFEDVISNSLLYMLSGMIGLLGFVLAGVAIMIGIIDPETSDRIDKSMKKEATEELLNHFEYFAFMLTVEVIYLLIIYFAVNSNLKILPLCIFIPLITWTIYTVLFNLFYAVSLVSNLVRIFSIIRTYKNISNTEKTFYNQCNEIRIDMLIKTLVDQYNISQDDFLKTLNKFAENEENSLEIQQYFESYYKKE